MSLDDSRPTVAFDWSEAGVHATFDGEAVTTYPTAETLVADLDQPHNIVAEATLESWDPGRRQAFAENLRRQGHELYVYRPIHTARQRPDDMEKTHANDARVIFQIADEGRLHLYPLPAPDPTWQEHRVKLNAEYQRIRLTGGKAELIAEAAGILGPYTELPEEAQAVLGNGREYSPSLIAAVCFAARHSSSRGVFERLLGLHGSAYPSLLRSEVHHHAFRHARKRGVDWQTFRRQLRRTYSLLKQARSIEDAPQTKPEAPPTRSSGATGPDQR